MQVDDPLLLKILNQLIISPDSYLIKTGWILSMAKGTPCDINGAPLPWMNYNVIQFLQKRLRKHFNLFEYGSGYSTHFYAALVEKVVSIEYDEAWIAKIAKDLPSNCKLLYQPKDVDGLYCRMIQNTPDLYDVIIIDGRDRVNCLLQSLNKLTPAGVILLDDSQRDFYRPGLDAAVQHGFRELEFEGLKPTGNSLDRTTVLYRNDNCLGI
jgi:hypothetical protein